MGNSGSTLSDYESTTSESSDFNEAGFDSAITDVEGGDRIFQFKIVLRGVKPHIWRRIQVPEDYDFLQLHKALNIAMGWKGLELYEFKGPGNVVIGEEDEEGMEGFGGRPKTLLSKDMKIVDVFTSKVRKMTYFYDFGDGWYHSVQLEKVIPRETGVVYPRCLKGKRACPPEDCGGSTDYVELLEKLDDPQHEEHSKTKEWLEEHDYKNFDPDHFDLAQVNTKLKTI